MKINSIEYKEYIKKLNKGTKKMLKNSNLKCYSNKLKDYTS